MTDTKYPNFMMWLILRKDKISQQDLAKKLDKSTALVSLWCNGLQLPTLDMLVKICKVLETEEDNADKLIQQAILKIKTDILLKNGHYDSIFGGNQ